MTELLESFQLPFVQQALLGTTVMAIAAGLCSCWLVMVGWSLLGDAVSHAVLPGVVLSYVLGIPYAVGAFIAAIFAVSLVNGVKTRTSLREDTTIGIVFTTFFASGLVLISLTKGTGHLEQIIFGNVLGISNAALQQTLLFGGLAILILLLARRPLTIWAFDATHAHSLGYNTRFLRWILLACLAFVVVSSVQAVGAILVVAMLITPGATAYLLTRKFPVMLWLAPTVALLSCWVGLVTSLVLNISSGGAIVLTQSSIFALVFLFAKREGLAWRLLQYRRA